MKNIIKPTEIDFSNDCMLRLYYRANHLRVIGGINELHYSVDDLLNLVNDKDFRYFISNYKIIVCKEIDFVSHNDAMEIIRLSFGEHSVDIEQWLTSVRKKQTKFLRKEKELRDLEDGFIAIL